MKSTHQALQADPKPFFSTNTKLPHLTTTLKSTGGYLGQMLHYFIEFGDGYLGQMLHYFNEFGGYLGQMCTTGIVKRSCGRAACIFDTAACTLHDCFILKKEDVVRFVFY